MSFGDWCGGRANDAAAAAGRELELVAALRRQQMIDTKVGAA